MLSGRRSAMMPASNWELLINKLYSTNQNPPLICYQSIKQNYTVYRDNGLGKCIQVFPSVNLRGMQKLNEEKNKIVGELFCHIYKTMCLYSTVERSSPQIKKSHRSKNIIGPIISFNVY
jgi:hypothetical protein